MIAHLAKRSSYSISDKYRFFRNYTKLAMSADLELLYFRLIIFILSTYLELTRRLSICSIFHQPNE